MDTILYDYAMRLVGLPYRWGGDDTIFGFDCSGLVIELLLSSGRLPRGYEGRAQDLFNRYYKGGSGVVTFPSLGCLAFYGKDMGSIIHVGMALDATRLVEAGGGGSKTVTEKDAADQNAYVRVRPIKSRQDFVACLIVPAG